MNTPMWIAGQARTADTWAPVHDPYTGREVGRVPVATKAQIVEAIELMTRGGPSKLTRNQRSVILRRVAELIRADADTLARLDSSESGLCLKDTRHEIARSIDVLNVAADATTFDDSSVYPGAIGACGKNRRIFTQREPLGLAAALTPFNHPLNQVVHKIAPAIAAGTPMIVKPSEKTPLTALRLAEICYEAGLPPEMLSVVTGNPGEIAEVFTTHPAVALINFTGSPAVGKRLVQMAGYRKMVVELGGNDPLIVMEDADVEKAAEIAVGGAYGNSGQRCTAVKRILVQRGIADAFVAALARRTQALVCGNPMDERTDIGTVIDEAAAIAIERRVEAALAAGATLVTGQPRQGALFHPTVLDHVPADCELVAEETFGPVAPVIRFDDIDQAIALSNGTRYGLSSGVCTDRLDWVTRFVTELKVGSLNVWEAPGYRSEASPFGGVKDSGLGCKEGVAEAIKLYSTIKTFSLPWPNP
ncbi:MAG: phosphonoacetaldehyde dehydrogenase [Rhodospirillaceae bacterium]|nr:phosphonoacetaldehyde dehydrogenase [Rhodospirillales bacterium]